MGDRESQSISNLGEVGGFDDRTSMSEALRLRDLALAATSSGIVIADMRQPDCPIIYCNPSFERITGYSAGEILGHNCRFLQGPDTDRTTVAKIREALQEGRELQVTIENYRKDGTRFWNKLSLSPVRDKSGNLTHFIGVQSDLSEPMGVQEALQQANDQLQTILEAVPGIVSWIGADLRYLGVNEHLAKLHGLPPSAFVGQDIGFLGASADFYSFVREFFAGEANEAVKELSAKVKTAEGQSAGHYLIVAQKYAGGKAACLVGIDITERKRAEEALLLTRKAVESSSDAIGIADVSGRHIYQNQAFCELFECATVSEFKDAGGVPAIFADPAVATEVIETIASGESWCGEVTNCTQSGRILQVLLRADAIKDHTGQIVGLIYMSTDITDRKRTEQELRQSEQRFRSLIENGRDIIVILDEKGFCRYVSPSLERILGYPAAEVLGRSVFEVIHPDELPMVSQVLKGAIEMPRVSLGLAEYRVRHKDDFWCVLEAVATNLLDEPSVRGIVVNCHDVTERKIAEDQLLHDALHDALTELPNRALLTDRLGQAFARVKRHPSYQFAVLFLDLDRFKVINDSQGHRTGDRLLVAVARRLLTCLRPGDTVARLGGDEFVILLEEIQGVDEAIAQAKEIQRAIERPLHLEGNKVSITASIGIALSTGEYQWPGDILRDADIAMYRAKALGKARYEVFTSAMHARAVALMHLEHDLRLSVEQLNLKFSRRDLGFSSSLETAALYEIDRKLERPKTLIATPKLECPFTVYYQPIVSLQSGLLVGFEALVRWLHPERGLVSPMEFISMAEETGLIMPLGLWVLKESCYQITKWQSLNLSGTDSHLTVAVNLSGKQFAEPDSIEQIEQVLHDTGVDARCLKLEITESVVMEDGEAAVAMLSQLKELGIELCIDDFGTGYSSLSYLHRFPIDTLKVDRSFVSRISETGENSEIVRAIVMLARSLRMEVVAEGVETASQLAQLRAIGCEYGQGYYFSKPLDSEAATALLSQGRQW
ncbi:MAG: EAL domain-containing protein [Oscillatoriaceae cyanobacterium Prado104]|jgi:diguanylate cyclase (GGDEF)-like protein/PAS domain S-box-containing protein|nr:EAL domain-containing protein [Oscillatoriaceae cyanobacterium Prado104]